MEDPTTLAINLTYLGTLGLAVLMFLGLGLIIIITLVVAGVGRLLSIILLAMVGIFPKKETTRIVQLPPRPARVPDPVTGGDTPAVADSPLDDLAYLETGSTDRVQAAATLAPAATPARATAVPAGSAAAPVRPAEAPVGSAEAPSASAEKPAKEPAAAPEPAAPKRDLLGGVRRRLSGTAAGLKDGAWKDKVDPRNLPKPAEVKSVVEHQTAHHPIVVAATKEPPVLAKDWADAVAEADRRAAARAQAGQPPAIKVTVRDIGEPTPSSSDAKQGPNSPDASAKPGGGNGGGNSRNGVGDNGGGNSRNGVGDNGGGTSSGGTGGASKNGAGNGASNSSGSGGASKNASGNGASNGSGSDAKKSGPNTSKNGKSPSPIRKGSLSSASRNS
ncbi:hypothetical protein [Arthrobacter sp. StoSoilB20]|uniref:hypothetical protein n=1 Tax=Arthrobacter sp. StoSoilB20 TaxID=2830995 RepID=UPI001CC3A137|nr:hypothetical protein [Arthrobacter sp. StoSoilB20]BCW60612.1 hypothetical protein StoSoilB20_39590 [Arthrobacter sp. StoSoilB20]